MNAPMPTTTLKNIAAAAVDAPGKTRPTSFPAMLLAYKDEIAKALPRHLNADTMARIALTCFRMNPKLAECQPASVFACIIQASQLGLRPGLLGECYLIPYKDQCTLQLGYQGLLELVRRSGLVDSISAHLVRERDEFDVQWGTEPGIKHRPYLDGDPGDVRLVYAVARLKGGGSHAELMTLHEINAIRNRSQNVINADRWGKKTPWDTDFGEMARKTVLRRICKYLPKSPDLAAALALDDSASRGVQTLTIKDAIENTFVPPPYLVDESTGEIDPPPPNEAVQGPTPEPARRGPGRPKKAPTPEDQSPPPAPPKAPNNAQAADDGPTRRSFDELAAEIAKAGDAEIASLVLDEARDMLDAEELNDLAMVYERQWKPEP